MSWFDDAKETVTSAPHEAYNFFVNPDQWNKDHNVVGANPGPEEEIAGVHNDDQSYNFQPAYNNAQAETEDDKWEQTQLLAKAGVLSKDEERMTGVKNWNNPVKYGDDDDGGSQY
jgi:hypothetical protein